MRGKIVPILFNMLYVLLAIASLLLIIQGVQTLNFDIPFDFQSISIKVILLNIIGFLISFGFIWVIAPYCLSRIFEKIYALAEDEIVEGVRIAIIAPYSLDSAQEIRSRLERGDSVYVESKDSGVFCYVRKGESNKQGILTQLISGQEDNFDCDNLVEEVIEMGSTDGFALYDSKAWVEMQNRGYSLQDAE